MDKLQGAQATDSRALGQLTAANERCIIALVGNCPEKQGIRTGLALLVGLERTRMVRRGERLAVGRTAEVCYWDESWVVKLFYDWFSERSIEREAQLAGGAHAAGLPVPAVGEMVRHEHRVGLLYERIEGPSMLQDLQRRPWTVTSHARSLASLQSGMHAIGAIEGLPSQRRCLKQKINEASALPESLKEAALSALVKMPDNDRLCHGDFHPGNVLLTSRGPMVVDWIDASLGNPLADVARSSIVMRGVDATNEAGLPLKVFVRWFESTYRRAYFALRPHGRGEYEAWRPIVAAARLSENIVDLEDWLLTQAEIGQRGS